VNIDWVVLELTPQGEEEDPEVLRKCLGRMIKGGVLFIPASISIVGDSRVVHKLIDNYVFVKRAFSDSFFLKLEGTRYISSVLTVCNSINGTRKIACVEDGDIERMRLQIAVETEQGIEVGDRVEVMSGPYKGITGRIVEEIPENDTVQVFISLRSKQALVTLPRSFLRFVAKDQEGRDQPLFSPFFTKIVRIQEWVVRVKPFILWSPLPVAPLVGLYRKVDRMWQWGNRATTLMGYFRNPPSPETLLGRDGASLSEKYVQVRQMNNLIERCPPMFYRYRLPELDPGTLQKKFEEYQRVQGLLERVEAIQHSVETFEKSIPDWKPTMVQNIIIDGHNLAYRVSNALRAMPTQLADRDGNPTALIFGFLKSLAALKKRFDKANFYVVWDGSKQRRSRVFPGYKANRPPHTEDLSDQMSKLRKIITLLGVAQVYNPEEETDDMIACLVRNRLKGNHNVIVSTDRDFLQLVTYTNILLTPKIGNRPETLYDPDKVVAEYGVAPGRMVHLRALTGDDSDNFPKLARVPKKVLASLLNAHGSLEGIFASNLAGITHAQYEKIRAFEKQARLNLQLMTLQDDLECPIVEASPDVESAAEALRLSDIQPDPITSPFFDRTGLGFDKSS
jgi:5'-3' exonuclease/transcription antitermination factor NusG